MPIKSKAQRGFLHAAAARGDISKKVVKKFEEETPKGAKLPAKVKKSKKPMVSSVEDLKKIRKAKYGK